jgi:hypothetical protein
MKPQKHKIRIDPFGETLIFVQCDNTDLYYRHLKTKYGLQDISNSAYALFVTADTGLHFIIYQRDTNPHNTIIHELYHFVSYLRDNYGLDEEATAWHIGHLSETIMPFVLS